MIGTNSPARRAKAVITAISCATAMLSATAAQADDAAPGKRSSAYVSLSAGLAGMVTSPAASGVLTAGTMTIPFTATVGYNNGWNARASVGYELPGADLSTKTAPDFRVEVEYIAMRIKRRHFTAGLLSSPLNDYLKVDAGMANGHLRVLGAGQVQVWAGAGLGYARTSAPDASAGTPCKCLGPARGTGLAYQGKLTAEAALSRSVHLVAEAAAVRIPGMVTAERPQPATAYRPAWTATGNAGLRIYFH